MRYFAKMEDGVVQRVSCLKDSVEDGSEFFHRKFGGEWLETSKNREFRKIYCGPGWLYHPSPIDGFSPPKPYESWVLEEDTCRWEPPVPMPDDAGPDKHYEWNEESGAWEEFTG